MKQEKPPETDSGGFLGLINALEPEWVPLHGKELGALAAEAQQMRKSGKQLESERSSGRPESRSKGVDR